MTAEQIAANARAVREEAKTAQAEYQQVLRRGVLELVEFGLSYADIAVILKISKARVGQIMKERE